MWEGYESAIQSMYLHRNSYTNDRKFVRSVAQTFLQLMELLFSFQDIKK